MLGLRRWWPYPPFVSVRAISPKGGGPAQSRTPHVQRRAGGMFGMAQGSEFDGYAKFRTIFGNFGKTAKRSHFGPPRPPESDSRPGFCTERNENQLIWSILEPFREDFLPNRAKSEPSNLGGTWLWIFAFFFNGRPWIFKVPKRPQKRHFWIAELRSFKMR